MLLPVSSGWLIAVWQPDGHIHLLFCSVCEIIPSFKAYFRKAGQQLHRNLSEKESHCWNTIQYVTKNDCQHGSLRMKLNTDCIALLKEYPLPFVPCEKTRVHPLLKLYRSDKNNLQVQMLLKEPEKLLKSL